MLKYVALAALLLIPSITIRAQQVEVEVSAAEPAGAQKAEGEPAPGGEGEDVYRPYDWKDDPFVKSPPEPSIAEEISVDLIDLERLRKALEAQMGQQTLRMSLEDAIMVALEQNPDILISEIDPMAADADVQAAKGEFDPVWQTQSQFLKSRQALSPQQVAFGGIANIQSYTTTINSNISGRVHTGTQYDLAFTLNKTEDTFSSFIEEFDSSLQLTITQPLLRGLGLKVNMVRIRTAQNSRLITEEQLRLTTMNVIADVLRAYWDLVGAVETLKVRRESLANAERLLRVNETRRDIGTAADIDVLNAKASVATRQSDLISARSLVRDAGDRLKQVLDMRQEGLFSKAKIVPTDRPNIEDKTLFDYTDFQESLDESVRLALEHRPELEIAALQIENAELDVVRTRNEMLPRIDVFGTASRGGRAFALRESLEGIEDAEDETYGYGIQGTIPLGNRTARGQHQRAKLQARQAELQEEQSKTRIMTNVHIAARSVLTSQTLVESNEQAVRLQEAEVQAEEERLKLGLTTSWQVLQIQEQLTAAQTAEVQARIDFEKALIDLQLAEGVLLQNLGIEVDAPEADDEVGYFESFKPRWVDKIEPSWP